MLNSSLFVICTVPLFTMTVAASIVDELKKDQELEGIEIPAVESFENSNKQEVFCFTAHSRWARTNIIHETFPNAVRVGVGRLLDHRLDFNGFWKLRNGSISTAVPDSGYAVWVAVFHIPMTLDDLKLILLKGGITDGERTMKLVQDDTEVFYYTRLPQHAEEYKYEDFKKELAEKKKCNSFQLKDLPKKMNVYGRPLPEERRPSKEYMDILVDAYTDARIPKEYIEEMKLIPVREKPTQSGDA